jgi:hypothetical protein
LTDRACHAQDDNALTGSIPASWMTGQSCFKSFPGISLLLNKLTGTLPQPSCPNNTFCRLHVRPCEQQRMLLLPCTWVIASGLAMLKQMLSDAVRQKATAHWEVLVLTHVL